MARSELGHAMGLMFVSMPQYTGTEAVKESTDGDFSYSYGLMCITAMNDNQHLRLFYVVTDPKEKIKELLNRQSVDVELAARILSLISNVDGDEPSTLAAKLPGVQLDARHPVDGELSKLFNIIIDLNDREQDDKGRPWTREEIADWIESTFDINDISFTAPEVIQSETKGLSELTRLVKIERILSS